MIPRFFPTAASRTGFRWKLLVAMMLVISGISALALFVSQRYLDREAEVSLRREFSDQLATLKQVQAVRHMALSERCRSLARRPRIHAALEDNALDLLYPSAHDELRDIVAGANPDPATAETGLHAEFYRFLDSSGAVISPPSGAEVGDLSADEERQLSLKTVPRTQQLGVLHRSSPALAGRAQEIFAQPIFSTETGEVIAMLVLGFEPLQPTVRRSDTGFRSGIWADGELHLAGHAPSAKLSGEVSRLIQSGRHQAYLAPDSGAVPQLLFVTPLNPGSRYPLAYEASLFSLSDLLQRQQQVRWQILSAGGLILLAGLAASHVLSRRLSVPVEKLAVDSEKNRAEREQAEAALEQTSAELQRSARFSADASHQLKTPVTVMRAGLEELAARDDLAADIREEISHLIHQSFRLGSVVDDLLLLARMDAGGLHIEITALNLSHLIAAELDDLTVQPGAEGLRVEADVPTAIFILGEKRYVAMILRNLFENAAKYNRRDGLIRVEVCTEEKFVRLRVGNTGTAIPPSARANIFERFHRGSVAENLPGHGLGLNIARDLARIHGGDLWLRHSENDWTEFEARFRCAAEVGI